MQKAGRLMSIRCVGKYCELAYAVKIDSLPFAGFGLACVFLDSMHLPHDQRKKISSKFLQDTYGTRRP